ELLALRDEGCAVLVISEELDGLFEISDRLVVIAKGRLSPSVPTREASRDLVGRWMGGLWTRLSSDPLPLAAGTSVDGDGVVFAPAGGGTYRVVGRAAVYGRRQGPHRQPAGFFP